MLSKLLATAAQGSSGAKSSRSGDFAMVSEGYDSLDGPWNLSNAVQVSELKNLIWTRVILYISCGTEPIARSCGARVSMFEITPDDIALLTDTDLRTLVGLLCEEEARRRDL